jgi:ABC-type cobalamin transport system permease subunit
VLDTWLGVRGRRAWQVRLLTILGILLIGAGVAVAIAVLA